METPPESVEQLRTRRISTEDLLRLQLAEINKVRGDVKNPDRVAAWSEALEAMADLLIPWAESDPIFLKQWEGRPCRVVRVAHPSGDREKDRLVACPTALDCRVAQQIIMGLMNRAELLVKRRTASGPGIKAALEAQEGAKERDEGAGWAEGTSEDDVEGL